MSPSTKFLRRLPSGPQPAPYTVPTPGEEEVVVEGVRLRVVYRRHPQAVRYRLTLQRDGVARCSMPPRGSISGARRFVAGCREWLALRVRAEAARPVRPREWHVGTPLWFRGQQLRLKRSISRPGLVLGGELFPEPPQKVSDYRPYLEPSLRELAARELPPRVHELAAPQGFTVRRVSIRNQRSRWGSCSASQIISLNWRLIQTPDFVRDYIILHELAHTRHLNHSPKFWAEVARICPPYAEAERWLKARGDELL